MKYLKFKIKIYDWDVFYIEAEKSSDAKAIAKKMKSIGVPKGEIKEISAQIKTNAKNGGLHIYNMHMRWSILFLYRTTSPGRRLDIICHEKRHIEDRIKWYLGLKGTESSAFVAGYIAKKLTPIIYK